MRLAFKVLEAPENPKLIIKALKLPKINAIKNKVHPIAEY